jgi:uncharacterized protein YukE
MSFHCILTFSNLYRWPRRDTLSIWHDVTEDEASARHAVERLEQVAARLDALTSARESLAEHARPGWHGAGRHGFERRLLDLATRSEDLAHHLRRAATTIEADFEAGAREQRRREERRVEVEAHLPSLTPSG